MTQITRDGSVFGHADPSLINDTLEKQNLFNTNMIGYRVHNARPQLVIRFRSRQQHQLSAAYVAAASFPGLASVEVLTQNLINITIPYREPRDVDAFRDHFNHLWSFHDPQSRN